jgi:hypothetical protein
MGLGVPGSWHQMSDTVAATFANYQITNPAWNGDQPFKCCAIFLFFAHVLSSWSQIRQIKEGN